MTCIVGIAHEGKVYMGADSCGSSYSWQQVGNPKVFHVGEFLIGCTTSFRMIDLLRFELKVDQSIWGQSDDDYLRTTFIRAVRALFKEHGFGRDDGGNFLVGFRGKLYEVQNDFSVLNSPIEGMSVGSGGVAARGSLYTTKGTRTPQERVQVALEAAEAIIPSVRGPFVILDN